MLTLSSSSSSSIYPWKYHIFLSFSGKDTRKSFTAHLYVALNRYGINTFRDDNNLERVKDNGLELLKSIGESWGSIIVFSKGYAFSSWCLDELAEIGKQRKERSSSSSSSIYPWKYDIFLSFSKDTQKSFADHLYAAFNRWCLDELAEIVKQREERGHQVFPIFYDVEVSDLRHQRERVQEAFDMHEKRYKENKDKTQRWRDALSQVANISGWILKDQYESNFIENIVKEISANLSQTCSQLKELHSKLNIRRRYVESLGLEARDFFHKKIDEDTSLSCNSSSAEEDPTEHGEICHVKSEGEIIPPNSEASLEIGEKQINLHGDPSCGSLSPCIFRTPYPELDFQKPQLVSIGPYHRGENLPLENSKYFFLEKFMSRTKHQGKDLRFYVQDMVTLERRTRRCYSEVLSMSSLDFVEMMLVDACFILEVLRHFGRSEESEDGFFPIEPWKIPILVQDLLMLENQIPFFVLEKLFNLSESEEGTATLSVTTMALKFMGLVFPGSMDFSCKSNHLEADHLLDLFLESIRPLNRSTISNSLHLKTIVIPKSVHSFLKKINPRNQAGVSKIGQDILLETPATIPKLKESEPSISMGVKPEQQCDPPPPVHSMRSAMKLQSSGIEFRRRRANRFTDINFKDGVLEIPPVIINDLFLAILINCMALEHRSEQRSKDLTAYVSFMIGLITDSTDAELLSSNGIISRFSYDDKTVAESFHSLGEKTLNLDIQDSYLSKTWKEIERYYTICEGKTWRWWRCCRRYYGIALFCITNFMFAFYRLTSGLNLMLPLVKEVKFLGHSTLDLGLSEFLVFCFLSLIIVIMIVQRVAPTLMRMMIEKYQRSRDLQMSNIHYPSERSVDDGTEVYETAMDNGKDIEPDQDECHEDLEAEQGLASTTILFSDDAKICMEQIWAYLMDDGVSKIGVCGKAGVGKTAIMKKVNNQLLEETEKFNIVIWITISKEMNISKVQKSIADAMKVDLPKAEDEAIRARFIYKKLSQKGKYVLILDDLWDKLSLEEVGIPEPCNGSKLVVTTQLLDVCRYLGCRVVRMSTEPDPWRLFQKTVGQDVLDYPDLLPIEESVAAEYDANRIVVNSIN
ncbi:uncharacterized protein LOC111276204 [Durio zibethinus]|uniref:Uncharacterized protein LOC111276204 n=1 Tax=Durio zibethinus TaxID=66656 RepID=A0A6P5WPR4_DURZI|nr:uncharacterized protein LOC111276204 [Durio zibethinus]